MIRPIRSGFIMTPSMIDVRARRDQGGHERERGGGRIGRHHDLGAPKLRLALKGDRTAVAPWGSTSTVAPKWLQHPFGVVAGRLALDHRGAPRRVQAGEENGGLDLGRGRRGLVGDRNRSRAALAGSAAPGRPRPRSPRSRPSGPADRGSAASGVCATRHPRRTSR